MLWKIIPDLYELDQMIGMKSVKESIFYQIIYYIQGMHIQSGKSHTKNEEYLHMAIYGCPGSGKTTIAKIIGRLYKNLGILSENSTFTVAFKDDMVCKYIGGSAIKTRKLLESCLPGILFLDEAYSFGSNSSGNADSFSKEAIDTLVGFLSEHKNDFCCIIAGYEDDVQKYFLV